MHACMCLCLKGEIIPRGDNCLDSERASLRIASSRAWPTTRPSCFQMNCCVTRAREELLRLSTMVRPTPADRWRRSGGRGDVKSPDASGAVCCPVEKEWRWWVSNWTVGAYQGCCRSPVPWGSGEQLARASQGGGGWVVVWVAGDCVGNSISCGRLVTDSSDSYRVLLLDWQRSSS